MDNDGYIIVSCKLTSDSSSCHDRCNELTNKDIDKSCVKLLNTTGDDPCSRLKVSWTTYLRFKEYFDLIEDYEY